MGAKIPRKKSKGKVAAVLRRFQTDKAKHQAARLRRQASPSVSPRFSPPSTKGLSADDVRRLVDEAVGTAVSTAVAQTVSALTAQRPAGPVVTAPSPPTTKAPTAGLDLSQASQLQTFANFWDQKEDTSAKSAAKVERARKKAQQGKYVGADIAFLGSLTDSGSHLFSGMENKRRAGVPKVEDFEGLVAALAWISSERAAKIQDPTPPLTPEGPLPPSERAAFLSTSTKYLALLADVAQNHSIQSIISFDDWNRNHAATAQRTWMEWPQRHWERFFSGSAKGISTQSKPQKKSTPKRPRNTVSDNNPSVVCLNWRDYGRCTYPNCKRSHIGPGGQGKGGNAPRRQKPRGR